MVATARRRMFRLQLGVDRKSTASWWMGSLTVRVGIVRVKAGEGAEKSFRSQRKTRRGLRGGATGLARLRVTREVAHLLVSAIRTAAPVTSTAPEGETRSSRVVNHKGRKFLWAVKAANRIAARKPTKQLIEVVPSDLGRLSRSQAREAVRALGVGDSVRWARFARSWHLYSYKCRHVGVPTEGQSPLHFLGLRAPQTGGEDLMELAFLSGLRPRAVTPPPPPRHVVCRSCGYIGLFGTHDVAACVEARILRERAEGEKNRPRRGTRRPR